MSDTPQGLDPVEAAHRLLNHAVGEDEPLPAKLEAAWAEWSRGVQKVDERGMTLLRAAFEAGWGAAIRP